jgi:anti-anti-sigma factor
VEQFSFAFVATEHGCQLVLEGELDAAAAERLAGAEPPPELESPLLEVSLAGVTFLDSAGIHALLSMKRTRELAGHSVRLVEPSDSCRRLFEITGLTEHLGLTADA